ncbi:TonB-dependent siderophore receptor [Psychrobium sp. 1_MG-2023]|uniref:TonB-dependent siderophore receptor n=1 Tax=Psychrobium sp. 1_MG-2023 TaxID=3062624 RepID=UPI000C328EB6|nr:TonB-dependent siderophore receptor [Psychrobium sp. 1_MG-2023]MDP2561704.1 TonB-dependent siderophore receptor [Psychrobium sp. 1_MG-2023]PKF57105.1 TonB-dependent siderophore receptor [Alteromonadales bacterium alter-6D02]
MPTSKFKLKHPQILLATSLLFSAQAMSASTPTAKETSVDDKEIEVITVSPRGLISYVSASATKNNTPIVETPVSVSVLTNERISALGAETIQDALGYVAGVYNGPYGVDTRADWAQIRGIAPLQYLDGLQMMFGSYNNARPNPYMLEQIEILKGPSSMLYGQGSTGGIVNLVTKRPSVETKGEIWGQLGNYDRKQIAGDFNTALTDDQNVLFRINGLVRDSGTQTDHVDDDSMYISPSIFWAISDQTQLTLLANLQKNKSGSSTQFFPHEGTILKAENGQIDSSRFVSEPGWDRYDSEQKYLTAIIEHQLNDDFSINWSNRYMSSKAQTRTMFAWAPKFQDDKRSFLRNISMSDTFAKTFTSDLQLHGDFITGDVEHSFIAGIDYQHVKTDRDRAYLRGAGGLLDIYNPVYGQVDDLPDNSVLRDAPSDLAKQVGFYVQDSFKIGQFVVNAALRHDQVEISPGKPSASEEDQSATTGRLGVLYSFENGIAPYISYSESFLPIFGSKPEEQGGGSFKPQSGEQVELGIKYQPQGTEHLVSAAIFDIKDKNRKRAVSPELVLQDGEVNIQGFELEAQLEFDQVDVYASYAYTTTENLSSHQPGRKGAELAAMPDHMLSTWLTYRPADLLDGLKLGLGYRYVGETSDGTSNVVVNGTTMHKALRTDSYDVIDMMIGYEFGQFDINLNVDNLTDEMNITSCLARGDCFYGQRRTVTANVRYRF